MSLTTKILSLKDILQYRRVYFEILSNLTQAPLLDAIVIGEIYTKALIKGTVFFGCFDSSEELVGVATFLTDQKFTREGAIAGHIEEVVVRKGYEGRGIGSALLQACIQQAEKLCCYKVILDCGKELIPFYEKNGFTHSGAWMRKGISF